MAALRLLLVLFALLLVLADGLTARQATAFPHPSAGIMLGLLLGEAGLIATWAAVSQRHWIVRLAIAWGAMAVLAWPAAQYSGPTWKQWTGLLLLFAAGVSLGWKMVAALGWEWELPCEERPQREQGLRAWQCSLANLLEWTTTAALMLGMGSWLALPDRQPLLAAISMVLLAALAPLWFTVWLAEVRSWWSRGLLVLLAVLWSAGVLALNVTGQQTTFFLWVIVTQLLVTSCAALVMSVGGGRLRSVMASITPGEPLVSPCPRAVAP